MCRCESGALEFTCAAVDRLSGVPNEQVLLCFNRVYSSLGLRWVLTSAERNSGRVVSDKAVCTTGFQKAIEMHAKEMAMKSLAMSEFIRNVLSYCRWRSRVDDGQRRWDSMTEKTPSSMAVQCGGTPHHDVEG